MKPSLFAVLVAASLVTLTSVAVAGRTPMPGVAAELPPGPGRETLVRVCSDCHGVDLFEGQRRTRAQWGEVVRDMIARGANAAGDDEKVMIDYLAAVLGRVNVNRGSEADIKTTLELSDAESAAIVSYRTTAGELKSLEDLKKVPGLDFSRIEPRKDRITFSGD